MNDLLSKVMRGSFLTMGLRMTSLALRVGTISLLARYLGPSEFGVYAFATTLAEFGAIFGAFGISEVLMREVSSGRDSGHRGLITKSFGIVLLISIVAGAICSLILVMMGKAEFGQIGVALSVGILVPFIVIRTCCQGILRGRNRVIHAELLSGIITNVVILAFVVCFLPTSLIEPTGGAGIYARIVAGAVAVLLGLFLLRHLIGPREPHTWTVREVMKKGFPFLLLGGLQPLAVRIDLFMIGFMGSVESVGLYRVCVTATSVLAVFPLALYVTIGPYISNQYGKISNGELEKVLHRSTLNIAAVALIPTLIVIIFAEPLVVLIFGPEYGESYIVFRILLIFQYIFLFGGPRDQLLSMTGKAGVVSAVVASSLFVNFILNLWLIPSYAYLGAAAATVTSGLFSAVALVIQCKRQTGINPSPIMWKRGAR